MITNTFNLRVTFKSQTIDVTLPDWNPTLLEIGKAVSAATSTDLQTVKLLAASVRGGIVPVARPSENASAAGLHSGCKVMLLASSVEDIQKVRSAKELSGLAGFDHELRTAARRRRQPGAAVELPKGEFTFGGYESWQRPGLLPAPPEALKLLHRLAADPGISGVMEQHGYKVGLLSEMPPEGKVGISPVCVLGVNINAGQEISLRLRTDDLRGFRKYEKIRETLIHELAHMEVSDHDNSFKALNSLLTREVSAILDRYRGGNSTWALLGITEDKASDSHVVDQLDDFMQDDNVMAATARSSGKTLRTLEGQSAAAAGSGIGSSNPRAAAAEAALLRLLGSGAGAGGTATAASSGFSAVAAVPGSVSASGCGMDLSGNAQEMEEDGAREFEREDLSTTAAEAAMQLLGDENSPCSTAATATAAVASAAANTCNKETSFGEAAPVEELSAQMEVDLPSSVSGPGQESDNIASASHAHAGLVGTVADSDATGDAIMLPTQHASGADNMGVHQPSPQAQPGFSFAAGVCATPQLLATNADPTTAAAIDAAFTSLMSSIHVELGPSMSAEPDTTNSLLLHRAVDTGASLNMEIVSEQALLRAHVDGNATGDSDTSRLQQQLPQQQPDEDVATAKLRQAWQGLQACVGVSSSAADAVVALQVLQTLLGNLARAPGETKFKTIKLENPALLRKVGVGMEAVVEVLKVAGFVQAGRVLQWRRNDVGLVWLVHSAVQAAVDQVHAKVRLIAVVQ